MVLDVWRERLAESRRARIKLEKRIQSTQAKRSTLEEAFILARRISGETYERQMDKLREELTLAELELHEVKLDELDVDALLAFPEHTLTSAARLWHNARPEQQVRIQAAFFPEGLTFGAAGFGTAVICLAFIADAGSCG